MKMLICGKGGCGKSTVAASLAIAMQKRDKKIFLVDADESNVGLYRMLGLAMPKTLMEDLGGKSGFRDKLKTSGLTLGGVSQLFPSGVTVDALPQACISSSDGIRVMSVGKIHHFGEGCACPMGNLFRMLFSALCFEKDELVIVDTAAGVEHFGRSIDKQCDHILCVVDPSYESILMAKRVAAFAVEAKMPVSLVLNRVTPEIVDDLSDALEGLDIIGHLPDSRSIFLNNLKGNPLEVEMSAMASICDAIEKAWP